MSYPETVPGGCRLSIFAVFALLVAGCTARLHTAVEPRIEFARVPEARLGGPKAVDVIEGRAIGARPGQRIVLFAKSDIWWVQPFSSEPFTPVDSQLQWKGTTHLGTEYAALLVDANFIPPAKARDLPEKGGPVAAVAQVKGRKFEAIAASLQPKELRFSGFDWDVRHEPSDRGGGMNDYDPSNVWLDERDCLHMRVTKGPKGWRCAEVRLKDPLGYGTYSFTVENLGQLPPAAVLGIYTFDYTATSQNFREMNIEVSRWGDPLNKNAQFAVQPYYVPANVVRFDVPTGTLKHSVRWSPGRADFRTTPVVGTRRAIADYSFTSGVPASGDESVFIAFYAYGKARYPLTRETEIVIDRFEYIP